MHQVLSPAKLNLFLHITGQRADGYHNIQSVLCRLDFGDTLNFVRKAIPNAPLLTLESDQAITANPCDNLIIKAGQLLANTAKDRGLSANLYPMHITLTKRIPMGAGLGGGSSNAGTTLLALNDLWALNLPRSTLQKLALQLGADVPFFVADCPSMLATGIGELLTPLPLPTTRFLLLFPAVHNATERLFANPAVPKNTCPIATLKPTDFLLNLHPPYHNAFQAVALQTPQIATAFHYLQGLSATSHATPRLTGTGSAVFLPLPTAIDNNLLDSWQKTAPCPSVVANLY